jgi:hypothetical protein
MPLTTLARRSDRLFDLAEKIAVRLYLLVELIRHLFHR